jgi:hypothetical protein
MHLDWRPPGAPPHHAVSQQRHGQHVIQVRMAQQDVVDALELLERQIADARASIDEHIIVEQKGRGTAACRDGAGTTQDPDLHGTLMRRWAFGLPVSGQKPMVAAVAQGRKLRFAQFAACS